VFLVREWRHNSDSRVLGGVVVHLYQFHRELSRCVKTLKTGFITRPWLRRQWHAGPTRTQGQDHLHGAEITEGTWEKRGARVRAHQKLPRTNAVVFFRRRTLRSVNEKLQTGPNPAWGSPSSLEECWAHSSVSQTRDRSGPAQLALLLIRFWCRHTGSDWSLWMDMFVEISQGKSATISVAFSWGLFGSQFFF